MSSGLLSSGQNPSVKFLKLAQLRRLRRCEQVAAVCFRRRGSDIEFLLVQTGKGRWIFPKGHAEPGLTHAQAAALEAFEEAGVHGRMEEASFASYVQRKRSKMRHITELVVSAHLCEVLRRVTPPELNRTPTWFSPAKAKRRLREGRAPDHGADLARVIDRAVVRIQRLPGAPVSSSPPPQRQKTPRLKGRLINIDTGRGAAIKSKAASAGY